MITVLVVLMIVAAASPDKTLKLADGVEMAFVEAGKGEPALVFVHCGNCRKEIWRETLDAFQGQYRVVAMDLPGYGRSGTGREKWSIPALGADVAALVEHLGLGKVVLVGNSLGGPVSLEAVARLGRERVLGVVAVDTLQNVEAKWPEESWRRVVDGYRSDFKKTCDGMMLGLLPKDTPTTTRDRVAEETCGNAPGPAIAMHQEFLTYDQSAALRAAGVPVWAINSTQFPTAVEANRKYSPSFEVILMEGVGHYPQVERPAEFQDNLRRVLKAMGAGR